MNTLPSPWPGLNSRPPNQIRRVTVAAPAEVLDLIEAVYGGAGFTTTAIHNILKAIYDELQYARESTYNPELLFDIVRRLTTRVAAHSTDQQDDARRVAGVCQRTPEVPNPTDTPRKAGRAKRTQPGNDKRKGRRPS